MIFYSAHNGKSMYYRVSERPEDISEWSKGNAFLHSSNSYLFSTFSKKISFCFLQNLKLLISTVKESRVIRILILCYWMWWDDFHFTSSWKELLLHTITKAYILGVFSGKSIRVVVTCKAFFCKGYR